jgi:hypothetical protein
VHAPLPVHVEGRIAYWFGSDVFSTKGFRPFLFASGGLAQVDAKLGVVVHENPNIPPPPTQTDNPPFQHLDAYRRMGQAFVGGGVGIMYAFTLGVGLVLDAKYMYLLPTAGNVLAPEFGLAVGFGPLAWTWTYVRVHGHGRRVDGSRFGPPPVNPRPSNRRPVTPGPWPRTWPSSRTAGRCDGTRDVNVYVSPCLS